MESHNPRMWKMNKLWYDKFIDNLLKNYPEKNQLVQVLMDLLSLERESVYRRLRQEIRFTADEVMKMAVRWHISLDEILAVNSKQFFFKLQVGNCLEPSEDNLQNLELKVSAIREISAYPDVEFVEISNTMSRTLTSGFPYMNKLHLLKWMNQYDKKETLPFSQLQFSREATRYLTDFYQMNKKLSNSSFIWDKMLFHSFACDIRYFHSIYLITDEEKDLIKKELLDFLDYMYKATSDGHWSETGNKVNLYISDIRIETNYSYYYYEGKMKLCNMFIFSKNDMNITDPELIDNFRHWTQLSKKSSVLISGVCEKNRIDFFMEQRQIIEDL